MILKTDRVWAILKYRRCFTTVSFFLSQKKIKRKTTSLEILSRHDPRILRLIHSRRNRTVSRETGSVFFENYPHLFVQPLRIPNISITEFVIPPSFFSKGTRSHPSPNSSASLSTNTRKKSWPRVVEKASLYSPLDPRGWSSWLSATRLIEKSIIYIYIYYAIYTRLSVSCRPFHGVPTPVSWKRGTASS